MEQQSGYFFGIDFGTTNSATVCFAKIKDNQEVIYCGDDEMRPIPSAIAIDKTTGKVYSGREAWDRRSELAETCEYISSVKSMLGDGWSRVIAGKEWTPVEIAAEVFKGLQKTALETTGVTIDQAVVAIPVGFSSDKREKLRNAAAMAGIKISSFISEPTAAFFANYHELRNTDTVAVFDWGGGTLDVCILRHQQGKIFELATGGRNVAGDKIDIKLARKLHAVIDRKKHLNLSFDDMPAQCKDRLLVRTERAKRMLSDDDTATVSLNNYGEYGIVRETITYDWFAEVIDEEVNMAIECLKEVIRESGLGINSIDKIVMVGGSSNLIPLIEKMEKMFPDKLYFPEETMWNVGMGAAMLSANPGSYFSNQTIGLRLSDDTLFSLLKKDKNINGWSRIDHFAIIDSNEEARFVFSGSSDLDQDDTKYVTLSVPAYKFLQEQIILHSYIDENLVFCAEASSSMRPNEYRSLWKYERLKFYYLLPNLYERKL